VRRAQAQDGPRLGSLHRRLEARRLSPKANFNPDQPRDELGRWTDAGGAADGGSSADTAGTGNADGSDASDENVAPELVQESARDLISQTIANNPGDVARVANGDLEGKFLIWRFGYQTGKEAIMDAPESEIRMRPTYEVGVVIVHDPRADFGYRVVNAFPRNFNPRTGR